MATGFPAATLARKLARQNAAELAELPDVPAAEHIAAFAESARSYAARVPPLWNAPHHYYRGTVVTVGAMAGVACAEWNVDAWDLARSLGVHYRAADPEIVFDGWREGTPTGAAGRGRGPAGRGAGGRRHRGDVAADVRPRPRLGRLSARWPKVETWAR